MKYLEHNGQIAAACGTFALVACIEWLAEQLIAYVMFLWRVAAMVAGLV
jgi:hypothetical protein